MIKNLKKIIIMNYRIIIFTKLALLLFCQLLAQSETEIRGFLKTFPVGKESSLEISNKYGSIHITPWNKDSVSIRSEIKAFASSHEKLRKMFDGITVNISETNNLVRAQTDFTQNISMLFESFKGMTSKLISYDSRVEINYFINMPDYLNLKIENKYGDVYMENNTGEFSISASNGSFKANSIGKESSITLTFCDATLNSVVSGKINTSFSDVTIGESTDLSINSISSRYEIKKAGRIHSESRRDKFYIDKIENLQSDSYFTDYKISDLKKELNLTTRYGSVDTYLIDKGFESVSINASYTDISLEFDQNSAYNLDIRHINSFLVLPDKNTKTEQKAISEEKKEYMTFGTVGKNPGSAKLKIDATRGNIYIK
jgi:hypothetical protein